jgi:hypothetical protein
MSPLNDDHFMLTPFSFHKALISDEIPGVLRLDSALHLQRNVVLSERNRTSSTKTFRKCLCFYDFPEALQSHGGAHVDELLHEPKGDQGGKRTVNRILTLPF